MALITSIDIRADQAGFTLIELMIVVVVIAILGAIALPSYREHVIKTRRAAAGACLLEQAQIMERFYTTHMTYTGAPDPAGGCVNDIAEYYTLPAATVAGSGRGFSLEARPVSGKQDDAKCGTLTLDQTGTKGESGTGTVTDCW